jgi:hypothetical protein
MHANEVTDLMSGRGEDRAWRRRSRNAAGVFAIVALLVRAL